MSYKRFSIVCMIIVMAFSVSSSMGQESTPEQTEAPEVTEIPEATETPELTETPESTESPEATESPEQTETPSENGTYIVRAGDTLFKIATRFGLTLSELADANGISNPSLIYVGQVLIIPGVSDIPNPVPTQAPAKSSPVATGSSYIVQAGDTLFRIAVRNHTTVNTLIHLNPQIANSNVIYVGQHINLPAPEASPTATSEAELNFSVAPGIEVFLGDGVDINALVSQVSQLNVLWVKITVDWAKIEPEQGNFDFSQLDEAVQAFDSAGFNLILTLTGAPNWSRPSATELALLQPTYGPPDKLSDYGAFVGTVAEHYVSVVDAYEIWYQPNNRLSWMIPDVTLRSDGFPDARLSSVRYIDMLEIAATAINAADPDARIITAGLAPTGINDYYNSIDNFVFFEELLKQGALNYADVVGIDIDGFSNAPDALCCAEASTAGDAQFDTSPHFFFSDMLNNYRTILDRNGGENMPMWVTHFGWGTAENSLTAPRADMAFVKLNSPEQQSDYTVSAFNLANQRGDVGPMIYYNLNGCTVAESDACYYSAIDANGSARPVFSALANLELSEIGATSPSN